MDCTEKLRRLREKVDAALEAAFQEDCPQRALLEAMRYSLLAGGKRIRPVLTLSFCEACGGEADRAMPLACAVEMVHTYSLIHDDLPVMDNDDLRRGRPTNHKVYGEGRAVLAGDALQAAAFYTALEAPLPDGVKAAAASVLARAAGEMGMCGGQELDTAEGSDRSLEGLTVINDLKTGALLKAACVMGVLAGEGSAEQIAAAEAYGGALARAFQIRDDILDIVSTDEVLGKNTGSDAANGKATFASVLGVAKSEELVREQTALAKAALAGKFADTSFFDALADYLSERRD